MSGHARRFACMLTRRALPIGGGAPPNADLCRNTVRGDPPSSTSPKPKRVCRFQLTSTALHSPVEGSPVGGVGALLSQVRPSLPRPVPPPLPPLGGADSAVDWLVWLMGNVHADAVRRACAAAAIPRVTPPPLPSPYPALSTPRWPYRQMIGPLPPLSFPTVDPG